MVSFKQFLKNLGLVILVVFLFWPSVKIKASEHWQQVGGNGLGDLNNTTVVCMETWNSVLFAGIGNYIDGARIYRSTDGNNWTKVNTDGFGHGNDLSIIVDFQSFNNRLYATITDEIGGLQPAEIWSTANGTTWTQSGNDGLGHAHNVGFHQMAVFNNELYVGSVNTTDGAEMYHTADGITWNLVAASVGGFADDDNTIIWSLASFDGYLWAGTSNGNGAQVWRSTDGATWTNYLNYATIIPAMPEFYAVNSMSVFNNILFWFARSNTGAQIIKRVTDVNLDGSALGMGDINNTAFSESTVIEGNLAYFGTRNAITGGELWYSLDGLTATQIGSDGFGSAANFAIYALTFNQYLYIGFSNIAGVKIFRRYFSQNFAIKTKQLPDGQQGKSYSVQLETNGGTQPYKYSLAGGRLPAGLSLSPQGILEGTPQESGDFSFLVQVEGASAKTQQAQRLFGLRILEAENVISNNPIENVIELPQTGSDEN